MVSLLDAREWVKKFYQRYDVYIKPLFRFVMGLIVFISINKELGYDARLMKKSVVFILSLVSAFSPATIMVLLAFLLSFLHVFYISNILSVIFIFIVLIIYFLFARYTPKLGYVVLAVPILFTFKMPYVAPILMGLIYNPMGIIPVACGVIIYYMLKVIKIATTLNATISIEDTLQIYTYVIDSLIQHKEMIMTIVIFAIITTIVYLIKRLEYDYAHEIAVLAGALTSIFGFLLSDIALNIPVKIVQTILYTLISVAVVYIIHFFNLTLDYSGTEFAEFHDDVYYYYVKAIPKIKVTEPRRRIRRIISNKNEKSEATKTPEE